MLDYMLGSDINSRPEWIELQNYVITDNLGKSLISEGRKSAIMNYSKPVSVNINSKFHLGFQGQPNNNFKNINNLILQGQSGEVPKPSKEQKFNNPTFITNKGIGISGSKPGSVQKNKNIIQGSNVQNRRNEFISNQFRPNLNKGIQNVSLIGKPHSVISNPPYNNGSIINTSNPFIDNHQQISPSNLPSSFSNLPNFSKPFLTESPIKNQILSKNYQITPVNVSNISNSRPLRSIFPNPFYQNKTRVDENLVQMDDQQQFSSRTASQISRFQESIKNGHISNDFGRQQILKQIYDKINPKAQINNLYNQETSKNTIINQNQTIPTNTGVYLNNNYQSHLPNIKNIPHQRTHTNYNIIQKSYKQQKLNEGQFVMETFKLGSRYEGYKLNGMRHGPGKFFYQDGGMYDGNWVKNKMEGYGKLYYQSGKIAYDGNWVTDQFTGDGVLYNQNPDQLNQPFDYENFDNVQQFWTKYQGTFSEDSKNGVGILYLSNGQYFQGNFLNDTAEGQGVYTTINGKKIRGQWQNNLLIRQF